MKDLEGFRYALDNGAWSAFKSCKPWDERAFARLVERLGGKADFVIAPDIVGGGIASLHLSEAWLPRLPGLRLLAVQDGMAPADVQALLGEDVGLFLGGTTPWKIETMALWGDLASATGCWYHVARVNSSYRLWLAQTAGATSFDGSGPALFDDRVRPMTLAAAQFCLDFRGAK